MHSNCEAESLLAVESMYTKDHGSDSSSGDPRSLLDNDQLQGQSGNFAPISEPKKVTFSQTLSQIRATTFDETYYTIDEAISKIGTGTFQYRLLFLTGGIWAADAMEMMLLSFVMPVLREEWDLKPPFDGAISSVVFAGMLGGTAFWSIASDCMGRRKVVIFSNFGCAVFGALSGLAPEIYSMLAARFLVGFCVGGSGTAYTLFAEYAPVEVRGKILVIEQGFWSFGALFSVLLAWCSLTTLSWRWYMVLSSIPLFAISVFSKWMPESSRWLLACGKAEEAEKVLKYVATVNGGKLPRGHLKPVKVSKRGNPLDAFLPRYRRHTILLYIAFFMCVFGYYGISFISVKFFSDGDDLGEEPWKHPKLYWEALISASSEIPGLFIGIAILDRIGRQKTMVISFLLFALTSFSLIFDSVQDSTVLGVSMVFSARLTVSLGFMAIYIYFSEYYPTNIRSTALGMASSLGRIAGMSTGFVSEDLNFEDGILLYAISGAIAFAAVLFVEETMGHSMATSTVERAQWMKDNHKQSVDVGLDENYDIGAFELQPSVKHDAAGKQELHNDSDQAGNTLQ